MKLFSVIRDFLNEPNSPATVGYGRVMVFGLLTIITVCTALSLGADTKKRFEGVVNVFDVERGQSTGSGATDRLGL